MTFPEWYKQLGIRHFSAAEVMAEWDKPLNHPPSVALWPNIAPTITLLDNIRHELGMPIRITSGYRSLKYNKKVGGGKKSQHLIFRALDFQILATSQALLQGAARQLILKQRGKVLEVRGSNLPKPIGEIPFSYQDCWLSVDSNDSHVIRFAGGLGIYGTFTHLDCRGINTTWKGK